MAYQPARHYPQQQQQHQRAPTAGKVSNSISNNKKWIPPSTIHRQQQQQQHRHQQQLQHDAEFRKVRGILNKLTPEKFDKLSEDILNVVQHAQDEFEASSNCVLLKGVILLIFEKALDEPKYSSMYAQLCKRLCESDKRQQNVSTFQRLLLHKCKDEFDNRAKIAKEFYDKAVTTNDDQDGEHDAKFLAKRKMLGNIKFIGELGKLGIVHDSHLHRCCEQLLVGRKKQSLADQAEDLECLCHLMKTCGRVLDTAKAKVLMDQYFDRLKQAVENEKIPLRVRFMIQDVIELRRSKWLQRKQVILIHCGSSI